MLVEQSKIVSGPRRTRTAHIPPEGIEPVVIDGEEYARHESGGGLVALTAMVARGVYVAPQARVGGFAIVAGNVRLFHEAVIEENAIVVGPSTLRGTSRIGGDAVVKGCVVIGGEGRIEGSAHLIGVFRVSDHAIVRDGHYRGTLSIL